MQKQPSRCATPSRKWATPNHEHQFRRITKPRMTYSPTRSCQRLCKPWTCDSTGYAAVTLRDNFDIIGDRAHKNLADYFTKHHPASHHKASRPTYLTSSSDPQYKKLFLTSPETKSTKTTPTKAFTTTTKSFVKSLMKTERFCITAPSA